MIHFSTKLDAFYYKIVRLIIHLKCNLLFYRGLKRFEGDPVLIGTVCSKAGIQEFDLPSQLPKEAKGVRIIPVQYCDGRTRPVPNSFVKAWTLYRGTRSQHFIYRYALELCVVFVKFVTACQK
jgi:hypothetical protein